MIRLIGRSICSKKVVKISRMQIFSVLQLRAGLFILIQIASQASLVTCLLSWYIILKWEMLALGWLLDNLLVNCTSEVTAVFLDSIFQTSAGLSYGGKVTIFFSMGPFVDNVLCKV